MKTSALLTLSALLATTLAAGPSWAQDRFDNSQSPRGERQPSAPEPRPAGPQSQPQPGFQPAPSAMPQPGGTGNAAAAPMERQDHGVAATDRLHTGPMHGPTPNSIPGGQLITTPGLADLMKNNAARVRVFDVLGSQERLPGALNAVPAHQAGSFDDAVQREFGQYLQQVTQGQNDMALVFYCASPKCWMSYNAALRAIKMGYRNVLWYRGGVEAWKAARLPLQTAQNMQQAPAGQPGSQGR